MWSIRLMSPVAASRIATPPSDSPAAIHSPSGSNTIGRTPCAGGMSWLTVPVGASQIRIRLSWPTLTIVCPSGANATSPTSPS